MLNALDDNGVDPHDFRDAWRKQKADMEKEKEADAKKIYEEEAIAQDYVKKWEKIAKKCPVCGKPMGLYDVNTRPGNRVGGGYGSQWVCMGVKAVPPTCDGVIYNKRNRTEVFQDIGWRPIPVKMDDKQFKGFRHHAKRAKKRNLGRRRNINKETRNDNHKKRVGLKV